MVCMVLKVCKQCKRFVFLNLETKKKICASGNLPELYHGMIIEIELGQKISKTIYSVTNYCLKNNNKQKNEEILKKNDIDVTQYSKSVLVHQFMKNEGVTWDIASNHNYNQLYNKLTFKKADKIHLLRENNVIDKCRLNAINTQIIKKARQKRKISYNLNEYLSYFSTVEEDGAYRQLATSLKMLCLYTNRYGFKNNRVIDKDLKEKENFVKEDIQKRLSSPYELLTNDEINQYIEKIKGENYIEEQLNVLESLRSSLPCIVTGGAGVGKTTVIKIIINCYLQYYKKSEILLLAPTGKASRRLTEKTQMPACTIHKALRKCPDDDFVFYNKDNKLPHRLIIVDESSMIDTELMYYLLQAVQDNSKLIFVGDHNQLYPVGYGEPFFDFLFQLDVYKLNVNHRQDENTDILNVANAVLNNANFHNLHSCRGVTVKHISFQDIGDIILENANRDNVQIISPYNKLNQQINEFLKKGENDLNPDDKAMFLKNTKEYCNGDMCKVVKLDSENNIIVDLEGKEITVPYKDKDNLTLAYAITVHKMQGSESDKIIFFLPEDDSLIDKRMMYTAITRAKKELEIYYYNVED